MMDELVIIPARGGSKGLKRKNIKKLNGQPLIAYTIEAAKKVFDISQIKVSTDDQEIASVSENFGLKVPKLRPSNLAMDATSMVDVLLYELNEELKKRKVGTVVLLQPTSPFREAKHILEALKIYKNSQDIDMVVSVKETNENPYYVLFEEDDKGRLKKSKKGDFIRRQDCPKVYTVNGAIYIIKVSSLLTKKSLAFESIIKYEMDEISSVDIDTKLDFLLAETIIKNFGINEDN